MNSLQKNRAICKMSEEQMTPDMKTSIEPPRTEEIPERNRAIYEMSVEQITPDMKTPIEPLQTEEIFKEKTPTLTMFPLTEVTVDTIMTESKPPK